MARLGGYSGENPQGEGASARFLQLLGENHADYLPFVAILSPKATPRRLAARQRREKNIARHALFWIRAGDIVLRLA